MNNVGTFLSAFTRDPKQLQLVRKIIERTRQGKIIWQRSPTDLSANVGNELVMSFIYSDRLLTGYPTWNLFTVRDNAGRELVKVDNTAGSEAIYDLLRSMAGKSTAPAAPDIGGLAAPDPLVEAVNDLYSIVDREAKGDIDHAIALVDRA